MESRLKKPAEREQETGTPELPLGRAWRARFLSRLVHLKRPLLAVAAVGTVLSGLVGYWGAYRMVRDIAPATSAPTVPIAASDRRMTFAVLPVLTPASQVQGEELARSLTEAIQARQEARYLWARVARPVSSARAAASSAPLRAIGRALDVHFLLRATIASSASDTTAELAVVDVDSENVLATRSLRVDPKGIPTVAQRDLDDALGYLTYHALRAEVERARITPDAALDGRDFAFRAFVTWGSGEPDAPRAYAAARQLIDRSLALAPDDLLSLKIMAKINLCECLAAWAQDIDAKEKAGVKALDRFLSVRSDDAEMLMYRGLMYLRKQRYVDALQVAEDVLQIDRNEPAALYSKALALMRLGRTKEALPVVDRMLELDNIATNNAVAAAVHLSLQDYASASHLARKASTQLSAEDRANPLLGSSVLTLAAAEVRQGRIAAARQAVSDFQAAVPSATTVGGIRAWLRPHAPVPDNDEFFDALRLAGVAN